ncbi:MAG: cyclic nucleotide-binding domain-containing protein [Chloroflexi bacterium]|nr:cyclic nucleotide-binding domain-containing protein [Chloroflexota bacterium]
MATPQIIEALERCELFSTVDPRGIEEIARLCTVETCGAGDTVTHQGEFSRRVYLIAEGQVAIVRSVNLGGREATMTIEILGRGRGFGCASILCDPCSVTASAVCQKPTTLVSLEGADLRDIMEAHPAMGFKVMERLAQILVNRLRAAYGAMDTFR